MTSPDRFSAAIIAASQIDCDHWKNGEAIAAAAERVRRVLERCGAEALVGPSASAKAEIEALLADWVAREPRHSGFLYCVGHGHVTDDDGHILVTRETGSPLSHGVALRTSDLAGYLSRHQRKSSQAQPPEGGLRRWLVVILDCCKADVGIKSIAHELSKPNRSDIAGVVLFGTSRGGLGYTDRFAATFETAVERYDVNDPVIWVNKLLGDVCDELDPNGWHEMINAVRSATIRNPKYHGTVIATKEESDRLLALLGDHEDDLRHFLAKAQGAELDAAAWHFSGRESEVADLSSWLRAAMTGLRVVTGAPGAGKSALLGHLVVLADPSLSGIARTLGLELPDDEARRPPEGVFDVKIHLRGKTLAETAARVADCLPGADLGADPGVDEVLKATKAHGGRLTILADALDESPDALRIAARLLHPLAHEAGARVLVGTRSSLRERAGEEATDEFVLHSLRVRPDEVVRLSSDGPGAAQYLQRRLASAGVEEPVAVEVGKLVLEAAQSFLVARLLGQELAARQITAVDGAVRQLIASDLATLFSVACERLTGQRPATVTMLRALAFARGRGVPRMGGVWRAMAQALQGDGELGEDDLDAALVEAAPYVLVDQESLQSVYRLAHPAFEAHFRDGDASATEAAIVRGLVTLEAARPEDGEVSPYVVHHLAEHVASAGSWEGLASVPHLLDRLDPRSVASAARTVLGTVRLPEAVVGVLGSEHQHPSGGRPANRLGLRQLGIARSVGRRAFTPDAAEADWAPRSAVLRPTPPHQRLDTRHAPRALAALAGPDGGHLVAAACADRVIRMWDGRTGAPFGELIADHAHPLEAMCEVPCGAGLSQLAVVDRSGRVECWDPVAGTRIASFQASPDTFAIAAWRRGSATRIATGGEDGWIRVWDPGDDGDAAVEVLGDHGVTVTSLAACAARADQAWLVAGGHGETVSLWRLDSAGHPMREVQTLAGHTDWVRAVAVDSSGACVWSAGDDGTVRTWRPDRSHEATTIREGGAPVMALVTYEDEGLGLASGSRDGTVQVSGVHGDPSEVASLSVRGGRVIAMTSFATGGRPQVCVATEGCEVEVFDPGRIVSVATTGPVCERATAVSCGGAGRVLTGDADGRLWSWDADSGETQAPDVVMDPGPIRAMVPWRGASGAERVALGGGGEVVRFVDPRSAAEIEKPLRGHTGAVRAIVRLPGGDATAVTGAEDGPVRLWATRGAATTGRFAACASGAAPKGPQPWPSSDRTARCESFLYPWTPTPT
jgi:WD40 repeat protein